ncbi:class I SAM-dependent methyltransferase [candidate division WOR-3 bacterium]|nr:class I SAM-dependent methyltransferase [candidate division WOR-3 bacterium]
MDKYVKTNYERWQELVEVNSRSPFYGLERFKKGGLFLDRLEREGVGDIKGKTLLHLMCHFGMGTLSFARMGAQVTGIDFSPKAIALARSLSKELNLPATFVCSDVYELPLNLEGQFDIVFTSYGVLYFLPDLGPWAKVVAHFLAPDGFFYIVDGHPASQMFDLGGPPPDPELRVTYPYFSREPVRSEESGSYADSEARMKNTVFYKWLHPVSAIINSLISAGLRIENFNEYPFASAPMHNNLVRKDDGFWRLPDGRMDIPFMFSIRARK